MVYGTQFHDQMSVTLDRIGAFCAAMAFGLLAFSSCRDQNEQNQAMAYGGALGDLDSGQLAKYNSTFDGLGQTTGFHLLRPAYLPRGTSWEPETGSGLHENEAVITFYQADSDAPVHERPVIRIMQSKDPDKRICPPCPDLNESDLEEWDAAGTRVLVDVGNAGAERVFASIYFRASELRVEARFDW